MLELVFLLWLQVPLQWVQLLSLHLCQCWCHSLKHQCQSLYQVLQCQFRYLPLRCQSLCQLLQCQPLLRPQVSLHQVFHTSQL